MHGLVRDRSARSRPGEGWPLATFLAAIPLALAARLIAGWWLPFWFDEAFTGTIASQPDVASLFRWCLHELTGPGYYVPMWLWAKVAGTGDVAMRLPSILLSMGVGALVAWRGHPDRTLRLLWATMLLLWLPVLPAATEARAYPQLLFLATAQAMFFLRAVRAADRAPAALWATISSLAILTNYYALPLTGLQGIALLVAHRRAALRLWPALLAFLPALAWMAVHIPTMLAFTVGHVAAYAPMSPVFVVAAPFFLFGQGPQGFVILGLIILTRGWWWRAGAWRSPEGLLIVTALTSFAVVLGMGFIQATFQPRYLTPAVPGLLFGCAAWAERVASRTRAVVALSLAAFALPMAATLVMGPGEFRFRERRHFEFETASAWLAERQPRHLTFLWSTATGEASPDSSLAPLAGFFFQRAGHPVTVTVARGLTDPNHALLASAGRDPAGAILWVSDDPLPRGVVPMIDRLDPTWECRDFGGDRILSYACRRRG